MPGTKVYIMDELDALKGHCEERKQKQRSFSIQPDSNEYSLIIAKKTAPKYVLRMMSSINFDNVSQRGQQERDIEEEEKALFYDDEREYGKPDPVSPTTRARAVEETAKAFVSNIQTEEEIEHVADMLTCKKVDFEGLIRDKDLPKKTIDRKFCVHEHIKLKNESGAFKYMSHYFGSGSSARVPIGNEFPYTLSVADGRKGEKRRTKKSTSDQQRGGMLIFINPDFCCEHSCILSITGYLPRATADNAHEGVTATFKTTFWSNGDTNGLVLTTTHNVTGPLNSFGGVVPAKDGRNYRKSMPGWNGRVPMWVPFKECECVISRCRDECTEATHNNQEDCENEATYPRLGLSSPFNSTYNFQNTFSTRHDSTNPDLALSCAEASPYDPKIVIPTFGHNSSSRLRADGNVAYVTVYSCPSPEIAIEKLTTLSRKFELKETGGTTLHGNMPALNLACLHGNVIAARKLLKAGANPNRVAACTGSTPLHDAVVGGHHDAMKLLLQFGANQTLCDEHGMSPLHLCCTNNDVVGARMLLQHKDAKSALGLLDRKGRTPRMACSKKYLKDVIERECKKYGLKEKRKSAWWSNLAGPVSDRPTGLKKSTAEDFMKMAVLVAKHNKTGETDRPLRSSKK